MTTDLDALRHGNHRRPGGHLRLQTGFREGADLLDGSYLLAILAVTST